MQPLGPEWGCVADGPWRCAQRHPEFTGSGAFGAGAGDRSSAVRRGRARRDVLAEGESVAAREGNTVGQNRSGPLCACAGGRKSWGHIRVTSAETRRGHHRTAAQTRSRPFCLAVLLTPLRVLTARTGGRTRRRWVPARGPLPPGGVTSDQFLNRSVSLG